MTHLEYDLSRLNSDIRVARQEVKQLRVEAASLRHPKRIEHLALAQGLRMPTSSQIVLVK
jgi:cell division protein FtsL